MKENNEPQLLFGLTEIPRNWYMLGIIDLSKEENRKAHYFFGKVIQYKIIDPSIGRNNLLSLLRLKGILNKNNRPKHGSKWDKYFMTYCSLVLNSPKASLRSRYFNHENTCISGEGILEIKKLIESIRLEGGSI